jgi:hypothetical protein
MSDLRFSQLRLRRVLSSGMCSPLRSQPTFPRNVSPPSSRDEECFSETSVAIKWTNGVISQKTVRFEDLLECRYVGEGTSCRNVSANSVLCMYVVYLMLG